MGKLIIALGFVFLLSIFFSKSFLGTACGFVIEPPTPTPPDGWGLEDVYGNYGWGRSLGTDSCRGTITTPCIYKKNDNMIEKAYEDLFRPPTIK